MKVIDITLPDKTLTKAFYFSEHTVPSLHYVIHRANCTLNNQVTITPDLQFRIDAAIDQDQPVLLNQEDIGGAA